MRLSTRLLIFVLPSILVSLSILGIVAFVQLRQTTEDKLLEKMNYIALQADTLLLTKINKAMTDIELIANIPLLIKYVLMEDEDQRLLLLYPTLIRTLGNVQKILPEYYEVRLLLPDGYEEVRRMQEKITNTSDAEHDSELFQLIQHNTRSSAHILINPDTQAYTLYVSRPLILRDPNMEAIDVKPRLRAYLVISVDLQDLQDFLAINHPGENGITVASSLDGNVIFNTAGIDLKPALSKKLIVENKHLVREEEYIYSRSSRNKLLHFVSILPTEEMNAATSKLAWWVAFIMGLTVLSLSALLYTLMRRMVIRPIEQLMEMSHQISRGNLQIFNQHDKDDEFGDLGRSFEHMAENLRKTENRIKTMAYRDKLTGLPNRAMFNEYLRRISDRTRIKNELFALLFIDIDDFKTVNDTKGHQVGDVLLQEIAQRINTHIRNSDFVDEDITGSQLLADSGNLLSRLGGDEFTVLLPDLKDPVNAGSIAQRLIESVSAPFNIENNSLYVGASIGITIYPIDTKDEDELLRFADIAMYHAKEIGKNNFQFYQDAMNRKIHDKVKIESHLRHSIKHKNLQLEYQPQVNISNGHIIGLEALLRWHDPELGKIAPDVFIPVAENTGDILAIGEWVIQEACRQQSEWIKQGIQTVPVSINVSSIQFERQNVPGIISTALDHYHIPAELIEIEITESTTMDNPNKSIKKLNQVKSIGTSIALDDFGTGYSSLSYLLQFPIDVLKIDRNFVLNITTDKNSESMIAAIIALAHTLDMKVIAEGVELQEQVELLRTLQCDIIQGYIYSRPLLADDVPAILQQMNGKQKIFTALPDSNEKEAEPLNLSNTSITQQS